MNSVPAVIVRKGGFLSALFHGLFGFLIVVVVCASGLGIYALHVVDSKVGDVFAITGEWVSSLPEWQQNLPPMLAETMDSRRAIDYRDRIDVSVRTATSPRQSNREVAVIEVTNNGSETVTVLALNVVLETRMASQFRNSAPMPRRRWRSTRMTGAGRCCRARRGSSFDPAAGASAG